MKKLLLSTLWLVGSVALGACSSDAEEDPAVGTGGSGNASENAGAPSPGSASTGPGSAGSVSTLTAEELGEPYPPEDRSVRPSAGCGTGSAAPAAGAHFLPTGGQEGRYLITAPSTYDPNLPYPLGFVFHGANNTEEVCYIGGNCAGVNRALHEQAIVVYPKSFGTSWTAAEREQNVTYFDDLLAHLEATYCIDERRVFALGTSSGAHFSNILGCRRGDVLLAVVPGAGERLEKDNCKGRVAALVIHGVADMASVPFAKGEEARDDYARLNGCTSETLPLLSTMHETVTGARALGMSTNGCVDYQGCREGLPVRWCEHSEPGYDGTTHGWPVAGGELAWDFLRDL